VSGYMRWLELFVAEREENNSNNHLKFYPVPGRKPLEYDGEIFATHDQTWLILVARRPERWSVEDCRSETSWNVRVVAVQILTMPVWYSKDTRLTLELAQ